MSSNATTLPTAATSSSAAPAAGKSRLVVGSLAVIAVAVAVYFGIKHLQFARIHEETDDAQVEGDISPVLPRVAGYVSQVLVRDNERVQAGQTLLQLDTQDLTLRIAAAKASVESAKADFLTAQASVADARATAAAAHSNVATAIVRARKADSDLKRDKSLKENGAITESQLIDTQAAYDAATTQLEANRRQAEAADLQIKVAEAKVTAATTTVTSKQADLDYANLQASYATVTAPISGIVSHKAVEPGQFLQAGQTILSITSDTSVWVVANFKETQLTHMSAGQTVEFTADTYPDVTFKGKVESIAGATGARFALLPPDNASGNYVKVTQRVPVKILLTDAPDPSHPLRPGMSIDATVRTAGE